MANEGQSVTLDNIKNFRQLGSPCAGHPEYGDAAGIETTTGPLGQGCGNSVGMAMAAKWFAARYNKPGFELFDYNVYVLCSDGDLMEGVANEAASLAGHLKLDNLCWIYDDNHITIEGETELAFSENVGKRFEGLGWNVLHVNDANDLPALRTSRSSRSSNTTGKPTMIVLKSIIGWGSPNKANTHNAHGAPLGDDEIKLTKEVYGWPADQQFLVPEEVREHFAEAIWRRAARAVRIWQAKFADVQEDASATGRRTGSDLGRQAARGLGKGNSHVPGRRQGTGHASLLGQGAQRLAPHFPWLSAARPILRRAR